jgi:hypothetical protein
MGQSSLTCNRKSPRTLFYSSSFLGCTGILLVAKKSNGDFDIKLLHKDAVQTGSRFFNSETLPHLSSIPQNATVVVFVEGEYQKNTKDMWEMLPNDASTQVIARISRALPHRKIIAKAYSSNKELGKPSNAIGVLYDPKANSVKVYTDGCEENPYNPILEIK